MTVGASLGKMLRVLRHVRCDEVKDRNDQTIMGKGSTMIDPECAYFQNSLKL